MRNLELELPTAVQSELSVSKYRRLINVDRYYVSPFALTSTSCRISE